MNRSLINIKMINEIIYDFSFLIRVNRSIYTQKKITTTTTTIDLNAFICMCVYLI